MIADIALRKRDYDDDDLFDARGRYGAFDWVSIGTMVVASVIGWGLVVNNFAQDAAWNNWQGYLLEPLGLGTYVTEGEGALLGRQLGVLQHRRAARPGAGLPRHLPRPAWHGAPSGGRSPHRARPTRHGTGSRPGDEPTPDPVGPDGWLVVVDPQAVFADPGDLALGLSDVGVDRAADRRARGTARARAHGGDAVRRRPLARRVVGPYYEEWPFALVPDEDPLYAVVPELADAAGHVLTAGTFGKWPVLRDLVGDDAHLTLTGVSTDCCVLSTALPAADAGATVRVVRPRARVDPENHARALAAMALYGPQITIT